MRRIFSFLVSLILIGVCLFIDARYIEPKLLTLKEETIETSKLSPNTELKVVLFNDVHLGENYGIADLDKIVEKINEQQADLIIFAGDLVDDHKEFAEEKEAVTSLAQLKSTYGKYAVFGNHDHGGYGTDRYIKMMEGAGFKLLINEKVNLKLSEEEQISIIGVDDILLSKPDFNKALKGISEKNFNLFVSHAPDVVDHLEGQPIDLQVSGHSHGGQVRLPFIGAPCTVAYGKKYIKGMYTPSENPNMQVYVNSGIGTSQVPYRFLNPPEITLFHIKGK